jgi:hypothetical protein
MPSTDTDKVVVGLTNDTTYQFRVAAKTDAVGEWSNIASARPFAPRLMALISDYYGAHSPVVFEQSGNIFTQVPDATAFPTTSVAAAGAADYGGKALAISHQLDYFAVIDSGALVVYSRNGQVFTPLPPLPAAPSSPATVAMGGNYLVVGTLDSAAPLAIYSRSGSTFTRLADLTDLPNSPALCVSLSANGSHLVVASGPLGEGRTISVYSRTGTTFVKLTNATVPTTVPANTAVRFSPDSNYLVFNSSTISAYVRTGETFTNISPYYQPLNGGGGYNGNGRIAFSPNNGIFATEHTFYGWYYGYQPGAVVYATDGPPSEPTYGVYSLPSEPCYGLAFNFDGTLLAAGVNDTIKFYSISGTTVTPIPSSTITLQSGNSFAVDLEFSWPAVS